MARPARKSAQKQNYENCTVQGKKGRKRRARSKERWFNGDIEKLKKGTLRIGGNDL